MKRLPSHRRPRNRRAPNRSPPRSRPPIPNPPRSRPPIPNPPSPHRRRLRARASPALSPAPSWQRGFFGDGLRNDVQARRRHYRHRADCGVFGDPGRGFCPQGAVPGSVDGLPPIRIALLQRPPTPVVGTRHRRAHFPVRERKHREGGAGGRRHRVSGAHRSLHVGEWSVCSDVQCISRPLGVVVGALRGSGCVAAWAPHRPAIAVVGSGTGACPLCVPQLGSSRCGRHRLRAVPLACLSPGRLNLVTAVLTAVFVLAALAVGWSRARRSGHFPVLEVCAALLAAFLLWNKVHSPQYALWLLPFFVLTRVHIGWWAAYTVADLATYIGTFRFFFDVCSDEGCVVGDPTVAQHLMNAGVFIRAGLLLTLFFVFLREKTGGDPSSRPVVSHPSATLASVGEGATQPD